jgi:hypothetical protein
MGDVGPQNYVISIALMRSRQNVEDVMSFGVESAIAFTNAPERDHCNTTSLFKNLNFYFYKEFRARLIIYIYGCDVT